MAYPVHEGSRTKEVDEYLRAKGTLHRLGKIKLEVTLNGGSQTRRDAISYYKETYREEDGYYVHVSCGYMVTVYGGRDG